MAKQTGQSASRNATRTLLIAIGTFAATLSASAQSSSIPEPSPAFASAKSAYDKAWDTSALAFTAATFTESPSKGFGAYSPRASSEFSTADTLFVYAEPVGYAFLENAEGYQYKLSASYKLLNNSGQVLAEQTNFAEFSNSRRTKQRELSAALTFKFDGLPAGNYQLEARFTDEISGEQSGFSLPFVVKAEN